MFLMPLTSEKATRGSDWSFFMVLKCSADTPRPHHSGAQPPPPYDPRPSRQQRWKQQHLQAPVGQRLSEHLPPAALNADSKQKVAQQVEQRYICAPVTANDHRLRLLQKLRNALLLGRAQQGWVCACAPWRGRGGGGGAPRPSIFSLRYMATLCMFIIILVYPDRPSRRNW